MTRNKSMKNLLAATLWVLLGFSNPARASAIVIDDLTSQGPGAVINDQGTVASVGAYDLVAKIWRNGVITNLGTLGGSYSTPYGINNSGKVIGSSYIAGNASIHPFLWQNGQMVDLLGANGTATAINNLDQVVGSYSGGAFLWQNGVAYTITVPTYSNPGSNFDIFQPSGINDLGQVVGMYNHTVNGVASKYVAVWKDGAFTSLGMPAFPSLSRVDSPPKVNNSGQVIISVSGAGAGAFVWKDGAWTQLLPASNMTATTTGISDLGQVVGSYYEYINKLGLCGYYWWKDSATLLCPTPSMPYSAWITSVNNNGQTAGLVNEPAQANPSGRQRVLVITIPALQNQSDPTTTDDETITPSCKSSSVTGMCVANAHVSAVSLNLSDTPVGYAPQIGPSVFARLSYDHRRTIQTAALNYFNVGPNWSLNLLSYVQDDPNNAGTNVLRYVEGGGVIDYTYESSGYISDSRHPLSGQFGAELKSHAVLKRIPSVGAVTSYELTYPDGSKQVYAKFDGAATWPRRIFLTRTVDQAGNALTYNYDNSMRLTSITDAAGRNTTFTYGNANPLLVTKITDPFGRFATLSYTSDGRLASITDVIGMTSSFTYDTTDPAFIKALTTPYGTSNFKFTQDTAAGSRALELTDPMGFTERLEYMPNAPGIAANETTLPTGTNIVNGAYNLRNSFYWDKHALPIARPGGPGTVIDYTKAQITHWLQNKAGQTSSVAESRKQPLENRVYYNYEGQTRADIEGNINAPSVTARVLDGGSTQLSQATYNRVGKPLTMVDPVGRKSVFFYDDATNIDLKTINQRTEQTAVNGTFALVSTMKYNSAHQLTTTTDSAGQSVYNGYSPTGQLQSILKPLNQSVVYTYDAKGRLATVRNSYNIVVLTNTYPANCDTTNPSHLNCDLPSSVTDSEGRVVGYSYDALDRVTRITYPDGTHDDYDYTFQSGPLAGTPSLDLRKKTDRLGRITTYAYDANRQLTSVTEPVTGGATPTTRTTAYAYWENGARKSITDANGNVTRWDIDLQSRPIKKTYAYGTAAAQTETYVYENTTSRLHEVTDTAGQIRVYNYAPDDRVTDLYYTWTSHYTFNVNYAWDAFWPRINSIWSEDTGTTNYTYVPLGAFGALQLATEDGPFANDVIAYGYDAAGRMNSRTIAGGNETFGYDALGRMNSHGTSLGTFTYNYLGQTNQIASRSVGAGASTITTTWGYDTNANDRRLKTISNSGVARSYALGYAIPGGGGAQNPYNIQSIAETPTLTHPYTAKSWAFGYDLSDRLLSATTSAGGSFAYGYDKLDNVTSLVTSNGRNKSATYNALNQRQGLIWRPSGNLKNDGDHYLTWDGGNRLLSADYLAAGGGYTGQLTKFNYDGLGRRVIDVERDVGGLNPVETHQLWCGDNLCAQRTSADTPTKRFYPEGEHDLVTGKKYIYMPDHLGSVRDVLDATTGALVYTADYEPDGNEWREATLNGGSRPTFRYAGMHWHPALKKYLTRYRFYDQTMPFWTSRDPLGEAAGMNLYGYVGGNPANLVDPSGQLGILPIIGVAATVYFAQSIEDAILGITLVVAPELRPIIGVLRSSLPKISQPAENPQNAASGPRLARQLQCESAQSPFAENGALTPEAIDSSSLIPRNLRNQNIPEGFGKFTTGTFQSPSGDFQVHFYRNSASSEVYYGLDYKVVFNRPLGK